MNIILRTIQNNVKCCDFVSFRGNFEVAVPSDEYRFDYIYCLAIFNIANVIFGQKRTKAAIILLRATGVTIIFG